VHEDVLSPCKSADTLPSAMDPDGPKRSKTISAPEWWQRAIRQAMDERGLKQTPLAELVAQHAAQRNMEDLSDLGPLPVIDQSAISRCVSGGVSQVSVMTLMSEVLRLPPPIFVARDLIEARQLHSVAASYRSVASQLTKEAELIAADREVTDIEAGAGNPPKRGHTSVVRQVRGKATRRRS
jgi:hypothetical protein